MRIPNSSVSVPPPWCQAGKEKIYCYSRRPEGGGPICIVEFRAGDHRLLAQFDARVLGDFEDIALASPFLSDFSGTIKAFLSYKPVGGGNDREIEVIDTGIIPRVTT